MKNIKKYILGFLATLMLCITSVVSINNTQNEIVVSALDNTIQSDVIYYGNTINPTDDLNTLYINDYSYLGNDDYLTFARFFYSVYFENLNYLDLSYFGLGENVYPIYFNGNEFLGIDKVENEFTLFSANMSTGGFSEYLTINNNVGIIFSNTIIDLNFTGGLSEFYDEPIGSCNGYLNFILSSSPFRYYSDDNYYVVEGGTPVIPTNSYKGFWLNYSLSNEEMYSIFEQLDYQTILVEGNSYTAYPIISSDYNNTSILYILRYHDNGKIGYSINYFDNGLYHRYYNYVPHPHYTNNIGWNDTPLFTMLDISLQPISLSINGVSESNNVVNGTQNDLIKSIVSSTPYYVDIKTRQSQNESMVGGLLSAITTGINGIISPIIEGIKTGFNEMFISGADSSGTAINPTGIYDKIYFNTSLSDDEILSIIKTLTYIDEGNSGGAYPVYLVLNDEDLPYFQLMIVYVDDSHNGIMLQVGENDSIWVYSNGMTTGVNGWRGDYLDINLDPYTFENQHSGVGDMFGQAIGQQNEQLKTLISSTSFASVQTLTPIAYFLIGMFGLSIGIGLVWLVISIMKKRK